MVVKNWALTGLKLGPFKQKFDPTGNFMLLAGKKGYIGLIDYKNRQPLHEIVTGKYISDITFLNNHKMFAVAFPDTTCIYDTMTSAEVVKLSQHVNPIALDYLIHHFLLVSISDRGYISWEDTSMAKHISKFHMHCGVPCSLTHNPQTAVSFVGQRDGVVSLWSPSCKDFLMKIRTHGTSVNHIKIDMSGRTMVTVGQRNDMRLWDLRNPSKHLHEFDFSTEPSIHSLDISDNGCVGVCMGTSVKLAGSICSVCPKENKRNSSRRRRDLIQSSVPSSSSSLSEAGDVSTADSSAVSDALSSTSPMSEITLFSQLYKGIDERPNYITFSPFRDSIVVGFDGGIRCIPVPNVSDPLYDSFFYNPHMDKKQFQECEVKSLLEKLKPDMIKMSGLGVRADVGGGERFGLRATTRSEVSLVRKELENIKEEQMEEKHQKRMERFENRTKTRAKKGFASKQHVRREEMRMERKK
ncbi:WD repeat-containing protein WDR46/Utp7 like protein, partial [Aduncisulcus paluster]